MKKNGLLVAGLALVLVMVGLFGCTNGNVTPVEVQGININSQQSGIWVTGLGEVTVVPDIATLRLGVEAQEVTVAGAQAQAAEAMEKVMAALAENGVADKDIQTQYFNIYKVTRWDTNSQQEVVIGYRVTNIVTAKIRDIDKAGSIIDAVTEAGGDLTRIEGINFSVDDPSDYYSEAREEAMADAKGKAVQLANLAGVTLGKPTYISENTYTPSPITRSLDEAAKVDGETSISPGEMEISLNIQVVYAIQ